MWKKCSQIVLYVCVDGIIDVELKQTWKQAFYEMLF